MPALIRVPIAFYRIVGVNSLGEPASTARTDADLLQLVRGLNAIWAQADITFDAVAIASLELPPDILDRMPLNQDQLFIALRDRRVVVPDHGGLTGFSARSIPANGLSVRQLRAFIVRDATTVPSSRVCAHEIGHVLIGNAHPANAARLMSDGQPGTLLTEDERARSRDSAAALTAT